MLSPQSRLSWEFAIIFVLLPLLALAQPLPQPTPSGPGGSCPYRYSMSGSFCVPRAGAQVPSHYRQTAPAHSVGLATEVDAET